MIEAQGREWARLMLGEHMALRARLEKRVKVSDAEGVALLPEVPSWRT